MAKEQFSTSSNDGDLKIDIRLAVYIWQEDQRYFVFSPALDVTGYGRTEIEAKESFEITLHEFISYMHNEKTIFDELEQLGWTVNRKRKRVHAPNLEQMLEDNEVYRRLLVRDGVRTEKRNIELIL